MMMRISSERENSSVLRVARFCFVPSPPPRGRGLGRGGDRFPGLCLVNDSSSERERSVRQKGEPVIHRPPHPSPLPRGGGEGTGKNPRPSFWTCCLTIALSCLLCTAPTAAQDDDEDEPPPQNAQPQIRVIQQQQKLGPEHFDQVIFSGTTERGARDKLNSQLIIRVDDIDRVAGLKPDQTQKLRLAGQTDIKRSFDQLDAARRKFDVDQVDPNKAVQARRNLQPLRRLVSDQVFEKGSLFEKVARTLLTDEQRGPYQRQLQERREFRQRALRETILLTLDRQMPLLSSQRDELRELLSESRPVHSGPYESQAVWFAASKLPEERYQKILTEKQWQLLQVRFAHVRRLEQFLQQNGAFDEEDFDVFEQ
jgi:hypothetical protein